MTSEVEVEVEVEEEERLWSDLPKLILHGIAMRLPGPADLLTFVGVCRSWRSIPYFSSIEFFFSLPRPIFISSLSPYSNVKQPFSGALFLYSPHDYNVIYKYHSTVGASNMLLLGLSNGHFITLDTQTRTIVIVINPFTVAQIVFPKIRFNFQNALLTEADIAHPDCHLVLVNKNNNHIFCCLASGRRWQTLNFLTKKQTDIISFKSRLYLVWCYERIFEYDFRANLLRELGERSPFQGRLMESPYRDLVMLGTETPFVVCWKVMPAPKEDLSMENMTGIGPLSGQRERA